MKNLKLVLLVSLLCSIFSFSIEAAAFQNPSSKEVTGQLEKSKKGKLKFKKFKSIKSKEAKKSAIKVWKVVVAFFAGLANLYLWKLIVVGFLFPSFSGLLVSLIPVTLTIVGVWLAISVLKEIKKSENPNEHKRVRFFAVLSLIISLIGGIILLRELSSFLN